MKQTINNVMLTFKSLWSKEASDKLFTTKAAADLSEATALLEELPAKLEADITSSLAQTERIINQVKKDGVTAVLHLKRQHVKRTADLQFIIEQAKLELGQK